MRRYTEMPFSVNPTTNDYYMVVHHDDYWDAERSGMHYAFQYTTEGGWNTHIDITTGEAYTDSAMSAEEMAESYKCWLRPASVGSERWADTLAIILDEVSAEKNATEPTEGEEIGRYELLDELETHLIRALQFAEGAE